jgi:hypothetical protein
MKSFGLGKRVTSGVVSFGPSCQSWCFQRRWRTGSVVGRPWKRRITPWLEGEALSHPILFFKKKKARQEARPTNKVLLEV